MLDMAAITADVDAHVLDHAENAHLHFLEHLETFARIRERNILRRGDDDRPADRYALRQGQLDIAGAGRHIDHQVVEFTPRGVAQELRQRLGHHGAAPDHRLLGVDQEPDGHDFHSVGTQGRHMLAIGADRRLGVGQTHHDRLAGAIDIRIEQADPRALRRPSQSEIRSRGRLSYAPFAGCDGDHILDVGERLQRLLNCVGRDIGLQEKLHPPAREFRRQIGLQGRLQLGSIVRHREPKGQLDDHGLGMDGNLADRFDLIQGLSQVRIGVST